MTGRQWAEGLTFYAGFNQPDKADTSAGASEVVGVPLAKCEGRIGPGFQCDGKPAVFYAPGNFSLERGTLAFWIRPDGEWQSDDRIGEVFNIVNSNFKIRHDAGKNILFFMTGTSRPGAGFVWDYGSTLPVSSVPAKQWTHLTFTWDAQANVKKIYVNGKQVNVNATPWMRSTGSGQYVQIGENTPGVYDECVIYNRILGDEQIAALAQEPEQVAGVLKGIKIPTDEAWIVYPDLYFWPNAQAALFSPGQDVALRVPLSNRTRQSQKVQIETVLLDLWDRPVNKPESQELELAAGEKTDLPRSYRAGNYGWFKVRVKVSSGTFSRFRDVAAFACIPEGNPPADTFFGAHVNAGSDMAQVCRRWGFAANRVHDMTQFTWWMRMQPNRGTWAMQGADVYQRYLDLGYHIYGEWMATPHWAVVQPDGSSPPPNAGYPKGWVPTDTDALRTYVRESITRFPQITEWDIWNEPHVSMFWNGSPEQYVEMAKVIYDEAKRTNPKLTIYAQGNPGTDGPWIRKMMANGILSACDGMSFHQYIGPDTTPTEIRNRLADARQTMARYTSKDVQTIPLVNSESGMTQPLSLYGLDFPGSLPVYRQPPLRHHDAATAYIRSWVLWKALGVRSVYYYLTSCPSPPYRSDFSDFSVVEQNFSPRPFVIAQCMLAWQLDAGRFETEVRRIADGFYAAVFERRDGQSVAVMWTEDDAVLKMSVAGNHAFDLMGNAITGDDLTLTKEPVYLHSSESAPTLAEQLKHAALTMIHAPTLQSDPQGTDPETAKAPASMVSDDAFTLVNELGQARLHPVDMVSVVNTSLLDQQAGDRQGGALDEGPFNDLRMLQPGRHVWLGVPFVLSGKANTDPSVLTLKGMTFPTGPGEVTVKINQARVRAIFFANMANWATTHNMKIAEYVVNYADGRHETLSVIVGQNIYNWWSERQPGEYARAVGFLHPEPAEPKHPYRYVHIWCWENPHNDQPIDSITIRSTSSHATLCLLGITVGTW
ncbi:MAG: LamG domain-containing protein [Phycisphaeraceae bacterium]